MKRGDVVIVAATGDYGKPRAAVIVQTDAFPETHASVVICQMTSEIATFASQSIQVRKTVRRARIRQFIGRLDDRDIGRLNIAVAFVMGLAD